MEYLEENKIYNMDFFEGLKQMPKKSISCFLGDLPYGDNDNGHDYMTNKDYQKTKAGIFEDEKTNILNNDIEINIKFLREIRPYMKKNGVIYLFTNWKNYPFLMNYINNYTTYNIKGLLVYVKPFFSWGYAFRNQHEFIICIEKVKGKGKFNLKNMSNCFISQMVKNNQNQNPHPHEKDTALYEKLINHSSDEGDLVVDGFLGSGVSLVKAKELNRRFYGFELDLKYFEMASAKLNRATNKKLTGFITNENII